MLWYLMIWYDVLWHDMIWCDMISYDVILHDVLWHNLMWYDCLPGRPAPHPLPLSLTGWRLQWDSSSHSLEQSHSSSHYNPHCLLQIARRSPGADADIGLHPWTAVHKCRPSCPRSLYVLELQPCRRNRIFCWVRESSSSLSLSCLISYMVWCGVVWDGVEWFSIIWCNEGGSDGSVV